MADDRAAIAHLLRRTGFGPLPGQVETLNAAPGGLAAALDGVLAASPPAIGTPPSLDDSGEEPTDWWFRRMLNPAMGLHEKMVWFWHGHLTSSVEKVGSWPMMWNQHLILRTHALGNFRTMLQAMTIDPAMLIYLDGDPSEAIDPNENYSRELMELFTIGVANVTEANVKAGAKALAGWDVDWEAGTAYFTASHAISTPVTFLGRSCLRANDVVNAAVDHAECAPFVAAKLYRYFHGVDPTPTRRAELGTIFRNASYEIRPLVDAILREPSLFDLVKRMNRPRFPVEWVTAAFGALGFNDPGWEHWLSSDMGQHPFEPPNVAGWSFGTKWLAASNAVIRAGLAADAPTLAPIVAAADPVTAALQQCSIYETTARTRAALDTAAAATTNPGARASMLLGLVVSSPEFALA